MRKLKLALGGCCGLKFRGLLKVWAAAIFDFVADGFSQIEFAGTGMMCAKATAISVVDVGMGARASGATALFVLLAAAARAGLIPPDLLPGDGHRRRLAQHPRHIR